MRNTLVYHSPAPIEQEPSRGSALRPLQMYRAFRDIGVDILLVDGYSHERRRKWSSLKPHLASIIGVYSELRSIPIALTDADHIPRSPFMDIAQFRSLRRLGIPTAAFYRDIYWRFPLYSDELVWYKRWPTKAFFYSELWALRRYLAHFFLPSARMADHFPAQLTPGHFSALPPGSAVHDYKPARRSRELRLLYVGCVLPPLYDISPMLDAVRKLPGVQLTICCQKSEWEKLSEYYGNGDGIVLTHRSSHQLSALFEHTDALLMFRAMHQYLEFAMPVKLFEALGYGVPVITNANSEMGDFVREQGVGWELNSAQELHQLLTDLRDHPDVIERMKETVRQRRQAHTWQARAQQVVDTLNHYRDAWR